MRRRWRGILAGVSFAIFVLVGALCVRSIWVEDSIGRSNSTEEPLNPEALAFARRNGGFDARLIGRTEAHSLGCFQGKLFFSRYRRRDVMSRWDEAYERTYVNRPQWSYYGRPAARARLAWASSGFWERVGFDSQYTRQTNKFDEVSYHVMFPIWPIALLAAIWPFAWLRRFRRDRHRRHGGLCMACGYDLRGNSGRACPECGRGRTAATIGESSTV